MDTVTLDDIKRGLADLGLGAGMQVEVHSSLSAFGRVEGGAPTVIRALQETVTEAGAIVMSAFAMSPRLPLTEEDRERGLTCKIRLLDPDSDERTGMGAIADAFKRSPGVKLGTERYRVAAWGADREENAESYAHLHAVDGHGLLLGVDIYSLTSMHYVEDALPERIRAVFRPPAEVLRHYPEEQWYVEAGHPPARAWLKIQDEAFSRGLIREGRIGKARCMFFKLNPVIGLYRQALELDPYGLYGMEAELDLTVPPP